MIAVILPLTDDQAKALFDAIGLALLHCSDEREGEYTELRTKLLAARTASYLGRSKSTVRKR